MRLLSLASLLFLFACGGSEPDSAIAESMATEPSAAPANALIDCGKLGSYPEAAMLALGGATYVRADAAPANSLQSLTVGTLEDVRGWGGKTATYTREVGAPCLVASCVGQTGKLTTIGDNPAVGGVISFDDGSGQWQGKDAYFVTNTALDADGHLAALCLAHPGTGERVLLTRAP